MQANVFVLIPTYNRSRYIRECLLSILKQTHQDLGVIIYDDGSSDDTAICVARMNDARITYHRSNDNNGIVHARNWLLEFARRAKIKYACWQDSDDVSHHDRISEQLAFMEETQSPMVLGGWVPFHGDPPKFPARAAHANNGVIIFASAFFEVDKVPDFREIKRDPTPTTLGGEDVVWRNELLEKYGEPPEVRKQLYFVRRHSDRIGIWRNHPASNPDWYKRMSDRVK